MQQHQSNTSRHEQTALDSPALALLKAWWCQEESAWTQEFEHDQTGKQIEAENL